MALHDRVFRCGERARLIEDRLGDRDLPDIVQRRAHPQDAQARAAEAEGSSELFRVLCQPLAMPLGGRVFRLDRVGQAEDHRLAAVEIFEQERLRDRPSICNANRRAIARVPA